EGIASIGKGDAAAARDKAIDGALRKAIEQVVGTLIECETMTQKHQVLNDSIYSRTKGLVRDHKVVSERHDGPLYRVTVAATVAVGEVKGDLQSLGLLSPGTRKPCADPAPRPGVTGTIANVSGERIYLNLGAGEGVKVGDLFDVFRQGQEI